jgi:hypothetical protein
MTLTRVYGYAMFAGALVLQALHERAWRKDRWRGFARHALLCTAAAAVLLVPDTLLRPPLTARTSNRQPIPQHRADRDAGSWQTDPPVSALKYLLGDHTVVQVFTRTAANYARYVYQYLPFYLRGYEWLAVFVPVGIVAALFTRRGFVVGPAGVVALPRRLVLNLNQIPGALASRVAWCTRRFPLALLLALYGLLQLSQWLLTAGARRWPALAGVQARLAPLLPGSIQV